jgi:PAS domain S-box-containing protein
MPDATPARILVVDDTLGTRYSLVRMLQKARYDVREATTGKEALRLALEGPDLIILDINLPDVNGYEVCRQVKSDPSTSSIPIMHMSATYVGTENRATGLERGADGYLTWPVEPRELLANIEALLRTRRAERAAREQEELLRVTLSSIAEGVIATDRGGHVTFLNPMARTLTGWSHEEAVGKDVSEVFHSVSEQTRQPIDNPAQKVLRDERGVNRVNHAILIARDGTERPIDDSASPILDPDGNVVGAVMVFRDVTEQRKVEQALREASQRKDEFLAMLAHELRNPLAPIRNALEVLNLLGGRQPAEQQARAMIERQVDHLVRLVDDLLDVSRITRGLIQLQKEPIDLSVIISRAIESSRPLIDARRHALELSLPDVRLPVQADPVRLAQVFLNLLNNAAKYTPAGGRIGLEVAVDVAADRSRIGRVRVWDTGIGIAPEMAEKVFDLFTQVDHTLERSEGGLGIGLTLVRRLTEMHGGTVTCSSVGPGQGSEFLVSLPLASDDTPDANFGGPQAITLQGLAAAGRRILVVDDNRDSAESLATLLRLLGNDVRTAYEGRQALVVAGSYRPDAVLLDLGLPGLNGYEVAKHIRTLPGLVDSVVVALSGFGTDADKVMTRQSGFDDHLVKPVDFDSLKRLLNSLHTGPRESRSPIA